MYIPRHFEITAEDEIVLFIESNAFGQLISSVEGRLFSTPMPFLLSSDRQRLLGHMAKMNPQHDQIDGQEVLVTLQGPHDYISPSWYEAAGVPTWNYQAVHIHGICRVFTDSEQLKSLVDSLTRVYEAGFETPWQPEYHAAKLHAITGVEIEITEIECKYKLSQNRSEKERLQVIDQLTQLGSTQLAEAMRRNES